MFNLILPPYEAVEHLEGIGNYAVKKYYKWPWRFFYRHKLKMLLSIFYYYHQSILDFGCGTTKILRDSIECGHYPYFGADKLEDIKVRKYDAIICSSVLEFTPLNYTIEKLSELSEVIYVASPMNTWLTRLYFKLIGDDRIRNSHKEIIRAINEKYRIVKLKKWCGLYFCLKGIKHGE